MKKFSLIISCLLLTVSSIAKKITNVSELKGDFNQITEIDFSNKGIIDFPLDILKCKNLKALNLSNNGFVKMPKQLSKLTKLKSLDLSENQNMSPYSLKMILDSSKFQLESLSIANCALFFLPNSIANQAELKDLDISSNYIRKLPYEMMQLNRLERLNAASNQLEQMANLCSYWWSLKEIDVTDNAKLDANGLMMSLSYMDGLERIAISNITELPSSFKYLQVNDLTFEHSTIPHFRRRDYASKIGRLSFVDCNFPNPEEVVNSLNEHVKPSHLTFAQMEAQQLVPFLSVNVDSLVIRNNGLSAISPIAKMSDLKWVDARQNKIKQSDIELLHKTRPEVEIMYSEPVQKQVGIIPPFKGLEPKPISKNVIAGKEQSVKLGETVFEIPADAFVDVNGAIYKGAVDLEYTEYNTPTDIFLSGISMTTSTEDGEEQVMLSSGGMFKIEAKDNQGNKLEVNADSPISANVRTQNQNSDMRTWVMKDDGVWEERGMNDLLKLFNVDTEELDSIMGDNLYDMEEDGVLYLRDRYVPKVKKAPKLKEFYIEFEKLPTWHKKKEMTYENGLAVVKTREHHADFIASQKLLFDGDSAAFYKETLEKIEAACKDKYKDLRLRNSAYYSRFGLNLISNLQLKPDYENDNLDLVFNFKDSVINIPVIFDTKAKSNNYRSKELASNFTNYQYNLKRYVKEKRRNKNRLAPFIARMQMKIAKKAREAEKRRLKALERQRKAIEKGRDASMLRVVPITNFGLWNCDARSRMQKPKKLNVDFTHADGEVIAEEEEQIVVIDRSSNGVLRFQDRVRAFFDSNSANLIVVFFATGIGIFQTWKQEIKNKEMKLHFLNNEEVDRNKINRYITGT